MSEQLTRATEILTSKKQVSVMVYVVRITSTSQFNLCTGCELTQVHATKRMWFLTSHWLSEMAC